MFSFCKSSGNCTMHRRFDPYMPWPKLPVPQRSAPASATRSSSAKVENMKALSQAYCPKFLLFVAQGTEAVLIHVLHELFLYEVVKIGLLMLRSLFSCISNWSTKHRVQDRMRGSRMWPQMAAGMLGEGWKRKETKVAGCATSWYFYGIVVSDSAPSCKFQEIQSFCFQMLFQRNIISIKHTSMYFTGECHLSKAGVGQILYDLSDWLHFIKSNYCISKNAGGEQPTEKHIPVILKNNQQIPRN